MCVNRPIIEIILYLSFACGISTNSCNFNVKVKQALLNEGFHRNITYGIVFDSEDGEDKWLYKDCIVGLDQALPPGVYANPDELGEFRRSHKLNAIPKNRINVELPTEQSQPSTVYIMGKVTESNVQLWIPVHARYHQARPGGGTVRNEIQAPKLYLRCPDQRLNFCNKDASTMTFLCNGSSREECSWKEIQYTVLTDTLVWDVPVGNTTHYYIVAIGTAVVVVVGSLYLLKAIHEYNIGTRKKKV